jgi:hypothetical protein
VHPDLITREKINFISEPVPNLARGPPLFINLEDVVFHSHPTLRYMVEIDVLEVVDCHVPSDSSSSDEDLGLDFDGDGLPSPL